MRAARLRISWRAPQQGFRLAVYVTVGDGRRMLLVDPPRARSFIVAGVPTGASASALIAGLAAADGRGPSTRATIKGKP